MPMGTTFRAGATPRPKTCRAGFVQLRLNDTKENVERAYSKLGMTHANRDYWGRPSVRASRQVFPTLFCQV
jgi:hypothetical protein